MVDSNHGQVKSTGRYRSSTYLIHILLTTLLAGRPAVYIQFHTKFEIHPQIGLTHIFMLPKGGSIQLPLCPSVCPVPCLTTLKLLQAFKSNLVYRQIAMRGRAQNPKTIIIPCIFIELSPLNHFVAGPCHILKSKKVIVMELSLQVDGSMRQGSAQEP